MATPEATVPKPACEIALYQDSLLPLYKLYRLEHGLEQALSEKVWLRSGGFLVIQQTEAFVAIDVNSGKNMSKKLAQKEYKKVNEELPVVNLKIRVYGVQMEYMRMLPLHKSQSEVKSKYGEFAEFTYRVCLTPELKSKILALGPNVEVLEPVEYREEIMSQISASLDRYMKKD